MRPTPVILLSAALLCQQTTALSLPNNRERDLSSLLSGKLDVLDLLDRVPGVVDKVVNTTILVVRALRETVTENGITQDDLNTALGINSTTGLPVGNSTSSAVKCPDVAVIFARGTNEPGMSRVKTSGQVHKGDFL